VMQRLCPAKRRDGAKIFYNNSRGTITSAI
jgi:hypothetical protein